MTVRELILELGKFNLDAIVLRQDHEDGLVTVGGADVQRAIQAKKLWPNWDDDIYVHANTTWQETIKPEDIIESVVIG